MTRFGGSRARGLAVSLGLMLAGLGLISTGTASTAKAHGDFGYHFNLIGADDLWNWDFRSDNNRSWNNVDWPIHMIFWNNATVNRVKGTDGTHRIDNDVFRTTGGPKWARFNDDGFWEYDADSGRKRFNCKAFADANRWTEHYRVYADNTHDRNWTAAFGYYVIVSTHFDYDDPEIWGTQCNNAQYGWDELAEENITYYYSSWAGGPQWSARADSVHLHNNASGDYYHNGNLHRRDSDGNATKIRVP